VRLARYFAIFITLLCGQLYSQQVTASPAAASIPQAKVAGQEAAVQSDWRENLAKNTNAPIKVIEFFDYQCPYCASTIPALEAALRSHSGQVEWILKHDPLAIHPDSMLAHQAALAAGEQGKFWEMHDLLFAHQRKVKLPDLLEYARQLHLDVPRFQQRLESGHFKSAVAQDVAMAHALGVDGTPTFFINGQKLVGAQPVARFQRAIEGKPEPGPVERDLASVSSLDLSHSPIQGTPDAPITIIEFSDLQCPFCARVAPALQELIKEYPTQIKWVFKNYPLSFHSDSALAHRALMAAGEQGKFWEMHDMIFAGQKAIKKDDLLAKARSLNLNMEQFTVDMDSDKIKNRIESDTKEGNTLRVDGTPTFFIDGQEYSGAMSLDKFKSIIDKELARNPVHAPAGTVSPVAGIAAKTEPAPQVVFGPANAPLTLVWFSDLQSELAVKATLIIRRVMDLHPGKIRLVFKNRPLESHPNSMMLHEAAMAANAQGKFWQMHDLIIANSQKTSLTDLNSYAQRLGLDLSLFKADMESHKYKHAIERDLEEARKRAVQGTPVFFLNAVRIDGVQPQKTFDDLVAEQLAQPMRASSH
jgi:protein-disulfide isomerase